MTKEQLAEQLDGHEYGVGFTEQIVNEAKINGLVICYGASDDLMELEGAIRDEFNCYEGGTAKIDREGILPAWEDVQDDEQDAEKYFIRKRHARTIKVIWGQGQYSFHYHTAIPHACFNIMEEGDFYCRAIVFLVDDL